MNTSNYIFIQSLRGYVYTMSLLPCVSHTVIHVLSLRDTFFFWKGVNMNNTRCSGQVTGEAGGTRDRVSYQPRRG
ncbi:MAG TPA: hypothetical protein VKA38_02860 [Draconibacterium sp.]|nr:hypothetical protein [Draconibacterium sp.]